MDIETIMTNIEANTEADIRASKEFWKNQPDVEESATAEMVDIYQRDVNKRRENDDKSYPKGTSAIVNMAVLHVLDGSGAEGLAHAYKEAKEDYDYFKRLGERERAEIVRKQYMEEYFLPGVELVINSASPDEVLNSERALRELDKYAFVEGSGKGYTASYIRQAYGNQLGQVKGRSDDYVRSEMRKLNRLMDNGQVREAYGIARKLRDKVERGENMMDEFDYNLVGKVLSHYA